MQAKILTHLVNNDSFYPLSGSALAFVVLLLLI
jgi:hypothetical protein